MAAYNTQNVLSVHHWNDTLFSFRTTRDPASVSYTHLTLPTSDLV